jgi:ADP-ribose pyrophosphatase YjhB (NUDIX family)
MSALTPRFCNQCGGPLVHRFIEAQQRVRYVCAQCGNVAYSNPQILVNTIVGSGNRVLLCRRADPPAAGRWGMPGGFMECGETLEEAAARETLEETGVRLHPRQLRLHAVVSLSEISQVYVGFVAKVAEQTDLVCGPECIDVRFFNEAEIPWSELTYPDIGVYLHMYFSELRAGAHPIHVGCLDAANVVNNAYRVVGVEEARWQRPPSAKSE